MGTVEIHLECRAVSPRLYGPGRGEPRSLCSTCSQAEAHAGRGLALQLSSFMPLHTCEEAEQLQS